MAVSYTHLVSGAFYAEPIVDVACGIISSTVFALMINKLLRARGRMPDGQALYSLSLIHICTAKTEPIA